MNNLVVRCCARPTIGYRTSVVLTVAVVASLFTLSLVIRLVRCAVLVVLVVLVAGALTGHGAEVVNPLARLL